jgi:predicted ATP-grasp superfamily ATP-dependent carboligase
VTDHVEYEHRPDVSSPVVVCAFGGWNDGGEAATTAARYVRDRWGARRFAAIDPEEFFDFQVNRPTVQLEDGTSRRLDWPASEFFHARVAGRDVVLFIGIEPNNRWRTFTESVIKLVHEFDVELVVTLGALLADVPHTRPSPVSGSATDPKLVEELGLQLSRYEGPTGIVGVLHDACRRSGIPSVSLWAAVPHYVSLAPSPRAALALCERLGTLLSIEVETDELAEAADTYERQVSEAVATDEETSQYVEELERRSELIEAEENLPSGDTIAAELSRFLRDRERGNGGPVDEPEQQGPSEPD